MTETMNGRARTDEQRASDEYQARREIVEASKDLIRMLPPAVAFEIAREAFQWCAPDPFVTLLALEPDELIYLIGHSKWFDLSNRDEAEPVPPPMALRLSDIRQTVEARP